MSATSSLPASEAPRSSSGANVQLPIWPSLVVIAAVGVTLWASSRDTRIQAGSEAGVNMKLPTIVGKFYGIDKDVSEAEKVILPKDTQFAKKEYTDGLGEIVNSQIVLAGADKSSIHRPEYCLPGQGWNIKATEVIPVELKNGKTLEITKLTIARPVDVAPNVRKELTSYYLYWFVGKNFSTPSHLQRQLHTTWDRVVHHVNHRWAYVIVSAPVLDGFKPGAKNSEQTLNMLTGFVAEMAPEIMQPDASLKQ